MRRARGFLAGSVTALVLLEVGLRQFASPDPPPLPHVERDGLDLPSLDRREIEEGIADAHFSAGGARLTSHAPIASAPTIVIIGDSHVVAREVDDDEKMGAELEARARAAGHPINVRQYGWRAASPAQYLLAA